MSEIYAHGPLAATIDAEPIVKYRGGLFNRRYIADATPFCLRTAASGAFALATARLAIVLDLFEFQFALPLLGTQYGHYQKSLWLEKESCII